MANTQGLFGGAAQGNLNSVPLPQKQTLSSNYIDFSEINPFGEPI